MHVGLSLSSLQEMQIIYSSYIDSAVVLSIDAISHSFNCFSHAALANLVVLAVPGRDPLRAKFRKKTTIIIPYGSDTPILSYFGHRSIMSVPLGTIYMYANKNCDRGLRGLMVVQSL